MLIDNVINFSVYITAAGLSLWSELLKETKVNIVCVKMIKPLISVSEVTIALIHFVMKCEDDNGSNGDSSIL